MALPELLTPASVEAAATRLSGRVHRTPVLTSETLNVVVGAPVSFKCENLQRAGAFKFRGALNAVLSMSREEAARGVATHSSGNHGAALALAARLCGLRATIVIPSTTSRPKRDAVRGYGAQIVWCENSLEAREAALAEVVERTGAHVVHPYDDDRVIAGQGTAAAELLADVSTIDTVLTPVGGGGLVSGTALAAEGTGRPITVLGAEPELADDAHRSLLLGAVQPALVPRTMADGLLTSLSERTFSIIRERVADIITVSEADIVRGMRLVWERMKVIIEPSAAVAVAAVLSGHVHGKAIGVVLSGGNADLDHIPWLTSS